MAQSKTPLADLVREHGSKAAAARAMGIAVTTLKDRLTAELRPARQQTIVQLAQPVPLPIATLRDSSDGVRHLVIPDTQCKPGVPLDHMRWAGLYAAKKKPHRIIHIGDHWDMSSLSSYDKGRRGFEGRRYNLDIEAGNKGMQLFMEPIAEEMERCFERGEEWAPTFDFAAGNHEWRVIRATQESPELDGTIGYKDFMLDGWTFHDYLEVFTLDGVAYSHFFTSGTMGRPVTTARALLTKKHVSCVMGHVQRYEAAMDYDVRGKRITGLFAGCYYQHDEEYLNPQGNNSTWRGIHVLYGVKDGEFTHNSVDLSYLKDRFEGE